MIPEKSISDIRHTPLLQVATPRVRTAVKPEIPHMNDHVSKLHAVGAMTQQKLQDIRGACEAASIAITVPLPQNCIIKGAGSPLVLCAVSRTARLSTYIGRSIA